MPSDIVVATIRRCIYCGKGPSEAELTREHVVPFALGGIWVLDEATCPSCQEITKHFEQNVLRPMLGPARVRLNVRTRNKKHRKKPFKTLFESEDSGMTIVHVLPHELPAYFCLPRFDVPGFFVDRSPNDEMPIIQWWTYGFDSDTEAMYDKLHRKFGKGQFRVLTLPLLEFGRMLAKMAHGFAVARYGLDSIHPFLPDVILGTNKNVTRFVGSRGEVPPKENKAFSMSMECVNEAYWSLIVSEIRLFPFLGGPDYQVVVGLKLSPHLDDE